MCATYDVTLPAATHIGVENRTVFSNLAALAADFASVEVPVAKDDLGVSLRRCEPNHDTEQYRDDHSGESEEQGIAGVYLWASGDGHSSSRLFCGLRSSGEGVAAK